MNFVLILIAPCAVIWLFLLYHTIQSSRTYFHNTLLAVLFFIISSGISIVLGGFLSMNFGENFFSEFIYQNAFILYCFTFIASIILVFKRIQDLKFSLFLSSLIIVIATMSILGVFIGALPTR